VDPVVGRLFVAGYTEKPGQFPKGSIFQFKMDGSSIQDGWILGAEKIGIPSGLALDPITGRVFWLDLSSRDVTVCSYSGEGCSKVASSPQHNPAHLTFFAGELFWTTGSLGMVHSHNLVSGDTDSRHELVLPSQSHSLRMTHDVLFMGSTSNPCSELACSDLCLLTGPSSAVCQCRDGFVPMDTGSTKCSKDATFKKKLSSKKSSVMVESVEEGKNVDPVLEKIKEAGGSGGIVGTVILVLVLVVVLCVGGLVFFKMRNGGGKMGTPVQFRNKTIKRPKGESQSSTTTSLGSFVGDLSVQDCDKKKLIS